MLPLSYTGLLPFPTAGHLSAEDLQYQVLRGLQEERARHVESRGGDVYFTGGMFRHPLGPNLGVLATITSGRVRTQPHAGAWALQYSISFGEVIAFATLGAALCFAVLAFGSLRLPVVTGFGVSAAVWLVLAGATIVPGVLRFRAFLRRCVWRACGS